MPLDTVGKPVEECVSCPVPPYCAPTAVPCHVPLLIVPMVARLERLVSEVLLDAVISAAVPVILAAIAFVTVKSVNQPLTMRVPVLPIMPLESVARMDAAAPGVDEDVMAWVWAVAVLLVEDTVRVPGVAIVVAKLPVPEPVTAPVKVIVWSPVFDPETDTAPAPIVKTDVFAALAVRVRVPVFTVRAVVNVALVTCPAVRLLAVPSQFVNVPDAGVPSAGVTNVGELAKTTPPVPVGVLASVKVTAPVEPELLMIVPSPETEFTFADGLVMVVNTSVVPLRTVTMLSVAATKAPPEAIWLSLTLLISFP